MAFTDKILSWRFRHLNIVGCFLKRRPTKGDHGQPRTPPKNQPKGSEGRRERKQKNKQTKTRRCGSFLSGMLFTLYESFGWQISASLCLFTWLVYIRTYCVPITTLNQNERSLLHYLGDAQIKKRT